MRPRMIRAARALACAAAVSASVLLMACTGHIQGPAGVGPAADGSTGSPGAHDGDGSGPHPGGGRPGDGGTGTPDGPIVPGGDGGRQVDGGGPGPDAPPPPPPPVLTVSAQPLLPGAGFYPRAIQLQHSQPAGVILASVVAPQASGRLGGTLLESTDDGQSFTEVGHIDDPMAGGGLCCATLYELPAPLGSMPAGTLLWSASLGGDTPGAPMSIVVWQSPDRGRTWSVLSTPVVGAVNRAQGGLWEPELYQLLDGTLACHYSDETDPAHSQKLVEARSPDGIGWTDRAPTVAPSDFGLRPGMANVRRLVDGTFLMSYEVCGDPSGSCSARLRRSADGWNWGDPADLGFRPETLVGGHFRHAPTLAVTDGPGQNGRIYLVGQIVFDGAGNVDGGENGQVIFANTEGANRAWFELAAPVPVDSPFDNFCPNYSSTLLPLDGGQAALEIASRADPDACRPYFGKRPLTGSGDAVAAGSLYRMVSVMSGNCLDVSGGSVAADANIQQWTCNQLPPQDWQTTASPAGAGLWQLTSQQSQLCLAAADASPVAGTNVVQRPCDGGPTQAWRARSVGLGYATFSLGDSDLCLDVAGGSLDAGGNVQVWSCNSLSPQIWRVEPR
jgi:hypothetical protein